MSTYSKSQTNDDASVIEPHEGHIGPHLYLIILMYPNTERGVFIGWFIPPEPSVFFKDKATPWQQEADKKESTIDPAE